MDTTRLAARAAVLVSLLGAAILTSSAAWAQPDQAQPEQLGGLLGGLEDIISGLIGPVFDLVRQLLEGLI